MDLKKKKIVVICFLIVACVGISIWQSKPSVIAEEPITWQQKVEPEKKQTVNICVYISGAVKNPGLHRIPLGSRGQDAIALAGGFLPNANKDKVNLAKKLKDGTHLNVPILKERRKRQTQPLPQRTGSYAATKNSRKKPDTKNSFTGKVNINSGSKQELERLPGIGPSLAERIIQYRQKQPFRTIEDLQKVPGIGVKKFSRIQADVEV